MGELDRNYRCDIMEKLKGIAFEELKELDLCNFEAIKPVITS
jgi:hypothetical protein